MTKHHGLIFHIEYGKAPEGIIKLSKWDTGIPHEPAMKWRLYYSTYITQVLVANSNDLNMLAPLGHFLFFKRKLPQS